MRTLTIRIPRLRYLFGLPLGALLIFIAGIACAGPSTQSTALLSDTGLMARQLLQYETAQPRHFYLYSQDIAALNAIMDARTKGSASYTFFFNYGIQDPIFQCPSRSYPIPGDTELTNPEQVINGTYSGTSGYWGVTVPMIDPNGVYTSHGTNSTYSLCLAPDGSMYIPYSEPLAFSVPFSTASWDRTNHQIVIDPTANPSFAVPYDANAANQTPLNVIPNNQGGFNITDQSGKVVSTVGATQPGQPTPTH